jgi:hypothetical protein
VRDRARDHQSGLGVALEASSEVRVRDLQVAALALEDRPGDAEARTRGLGETRLVGKRLEVGDHLCGLVGALEYQQVRDPRHAKIEVVRVELDGALVVRERGLVVGPVLEPCLGANDQGREVVGLALEHPGSGLEAHLIVAGLERRSAELETGRNLPAGR